MSSSTCSTDNTTVTPLSLSRADRRGPPQALPRAGRSALAVAEKPAGGGTRAHPVGERLDAVDQDVPVTEGPLDPAPLASGQVVYGFADPGGIDRELVQVVDDHVGRRAVAQDAAV